MTPRPCPKTRYDPLGPVPKPGTTPRPCPKKQVCLIAYGDDGDVVVIVVVMLLFMSPALVLQRLQLLLLGPLKDLSGVLQPDIRHRQLESVLQILQNQGDGLGPGWPLVLGVIGAIRNDQG